MARKRKRRPSTRVQKGKRQRRPGAGRRRAPATSADVNELEAKKKAAQEKFVEVYAQGEHTLAGAAEEAGVSTSTIWRMRAADPEFDAKVLLVLKDLDGLRVQLVEDSLFQRLQEGKASAAEVIFFLCNRDPKRWRSVQRVEHTGAGGGPIRTADLTKLTDPELARLDGLLRKCGLELQQ